MKMPTEIEKICLGCTLPICDDKSSACKFVQIERRKKRVRRSRHDQDEQIKADLLEILGRLVGTQAVEDAMRRAASIELIDGTSYEQ